jgi:uncharacterized protein
VTTTNAAPKPVDAEDADDPQGWTFESSLGLSMVLLLVLTLQGPIRGLLSVPVMQTWMTVFVAVSVQALPFLVLGVLLSAVIGVFVPASFFVRALPKQPALAVPVAGMAGAVLPGCECASVPVAGALVRRGVTPAAALAFLLSAPAINPIVLTATAVAFPGNPEMVLARFVASLLVACAMGWLWQRVGRADWLRPPARQSFDGLGKGAASLSQFSLTARLAFLVVGPAIDLKLFAMQAATFGRGFALRFAPVTFALAVLVSALVGAVLL